VRELKAAQIVDAIAEAAERWTDADFPPRVRATRAVMERLSYTEPVVDYALDRLFGAITKTALRATIAGELGSLEALDGFVSREGRSDVHYAGLERVTIVSSDTTIGVAIPPLVFAACAKANVVVKDRSDHLISAFVETLVEERPEFGGAITVQEWRGHDDPHALAEFARSDAVVVFGGPEALRAIRTQCKPDARFIPFGHRTSAGYIARETLADETARRACAVDAARDVLLYDGEGCLSLHILFLESSGGYDPRNYHAALSDALDAGALIFPTAFEPPTPGTAAARDAARFRQTQGVGSLYPGFTGPHLLVFDQPLDQSPPLSARTVAVYEVDGPAGALAFLRRHALPLEGFALCGSERPDILAAAVASGASRIARLGELQAPALTGEHGGVGRILPFVRAISKDR
jgi:hypothetical protein